MIGRELSEGDFFWYVEPVVYVGSTEYDSGEQHCQWRAVPRRFSELGELDAEMMFESEREANEMAFSMTNERGY